MNKVSRSIFLGTALAMLIAGCEKSSAPAIMSSNAPPQPVASVAPIPQAPKADPSVPDAATIFATQDTTAIQKKPATSEKMTKAEESRAMPLPGQANDHSTPALDKNKGTK